jgi:hypothetical protein
MPHEAGHLRVAEVPLGGVVQHDYDGAVISRPTARATPVQPSTSAVCCHEGAGQMVPCDRADVRSGDSCSLRDAVDIVPAASLVFHGPLPRFTTSTTALRLPDGPPPCTPSRAQQLLQRPRRSLEVPAADVQYVAMLLPSQPRPGPYS